MFESNKDRHQKKLMSVLTLDNLEHMKVRDSAKWHFKHKPYEHMEGVRQCIEQTTTKSQDTL